MQLLVSYNHRTKKQTSSTNNLQSFSDSENNLRETSHPVPSEAYVKDKTVESTMQAIHIVECLEESFCHPPTQSVRESKPQSSVAQIPSIPLSIYIFPLIFSSFTCFYWILFLYFA
jgi:hypothetical protein